MASIGARLAGRLEVGVGRDRVEGDEAVDDLGHLAGRTQQADVGAAVGDDGEVGEIGAEDGPDGGHGLAPGPPAADADGHAGVELGHELVEGQSLVSHGCVLSARRRGGRASCGGRRRQGGGHRVVSASRFSTKAAALLVGHAGHVQLVGEALLEPVAPPHVDRVDPVEGLLGPADDGRALGRDVLGHLVGGGDQLVPRGPPGARSRSGGARPPWPAWPCRPSTACGAGGRGATGGWRRRGPPGRLREGRRWRPPTPPRCRRCRPGRRRRRGRSRGRRR